MTPRTPAFTRRTALGGLIAATLAPRGRLRAAETAVSMDDLARIADAPVLTLDFVKAPVVIKSIELLKNGKHWLLRTRSKDGLEVVTVPHQNKMDLAWPVLMKQVIPAYLDQDARRVEDLHWEAYRRDSNYKLQGLTHGIATMAVESALLELMGRAAARPIADFFGGKMRRDIAVYDASGNRGNTPQQEIEHLQKLVAKSGAKALKFRLGARMSRNADDPPKRSEQLIPLVRGTFGPDFTLYADANSSYRDPAEAIRIGRLMEAHDYGFYEEPCEFDDFHSTKQVTDALTIPVALGEQEFSLHRWTWCIAHRIADILQPDLHYGGGFIRATKVARMAAAAGMTLVPHMSGGGLGYLDLVHFASFTPNLGPHMEFKGNTDLPVACATSSLKCENGQVRCPEGPGFGVEIDPAFIAEAKPFHP